MAYITDKELFKAVCFASKMVKDGISIPLAIHKSAKYYNVSESDIASELGKRGSSVSASRE